MPSIREHETLLVKRFVASFEKLNDMVADSILDPVAWQLASGDPNEIGLKVWRPVNSVTDRSELESIYAKLPARFPPIYERLILSYRWAEIDLQLFTLLANPPGLDFSGLLGEMSKDQTLWDALLKSGFIQFGKGADMDYDPVCFDLTSRKKNRDCRVVKIDHEEILSNNRVKVVAEIAESFEDLVLLTIAAADRQAESS